MNIVGCGGDGDGGSEYAEPCSLGGVAIEEPTYDESYSTSFPSVFLKGIAPIGSFWDDCYPCYPSNPGVTVTWYNEATGESGEPFIGVRADWFFYYLYSTEWFGYISLLEGENLIKVSAYEDEERVGRDCITVTYVPDTIPPTTPSNLIANASSPTEINLSWDESTDDVGVEGYKIYRWSEYIQDVSITSFTDSGLSSGGIHYCYTVSAYDAAENESSQSSQSCADTP